MLSLLGGGLLVLAFMLGLSYAFEIPARQALLGDVAGEDIPNALALSSSIVNGARVVGPAVAGVVVALAGEAWCFALNALSFLGTIRALLVMDLPPQRPPAGRTRLAGGLEYAARTPYVLAMLLALAVSAFFGMSYAALLPVSASEVLGGGPGLYGTLQACAGTGALAGGVSLLLRPGGLRGLGRRVAVGASALGLGLLVASRSRAPALTGASLVLAGFGYITQTAGTMTLLQGLSPHELRGRVMGLLLSGIFFGIETGPYRWLFERVQAPMQATLFSMLAFFVASASYRAFRARSTHATLLLVAGCVVILGRVPAGDLLGFDLGGHRLSLAGLASWILDIPNLAAKRGILIGVGLGMISTSLRIILGVERAYLGQSRSHGGS